MEALIKVKLLDGHEFNHLFPVARLLDETKKRGATVSDTVTFLPKIVAKTKWQVSNYVKQELAGLSTYQACEKLWHFVKYHIEYQKDEDGKEQIRSPRRLWHDRRGDCDCMTTFVSCCLSLLNVPVIHRITKYNTDRFQHIYPIVPLANGNYITMDCVANHFNEEVPYSEKQDYKMDLQFLDGITNDTAAGVDAQALLGKEDDFSGMGEFGKLFKRSKTTSMIPNDGQSSGGKKKGKFLQKAKGVVKKGLHFTNRANPATLLLRAGILASMKLNVLKVAEGLKWAYLSEDEARSKGADMSKFARLKKVLTKIEGIFYSSGGLAQNLKKAILTGHGNRHHEVSGFGYPYPSPLMGLDETSTLPNLLGLEIYQSEISGVEGLGTLGEPATGAAVAAASTIITAIAALIKSIGNVFPKKKVAESSENTEEGASETEAEVSTQTDSTPNEDSSSNATSEDANTTPDPAEAPTEADTDTNLPATQEDVEGLKGTGTESGIKALWSKHKKWLVPTSIGLGIVLLCVVGLGNSSETPKHKGSQNTLAGLSRKRKRKKRSKIRRSPQVIELM